MGQKLLGCARATLSRYRSSIFEGRHFFRKPVTLPIRREDHIMLTVSVEKIAEYIDQPLGSTEWVTIDQDRINAFADVTLDHQFIHIDTEKAEATPFGTTIAHGYLTMSLISHFLQECGIRPEGTVMAINYGSDKVRFLQPVAVDSKVRGHAKLLEVSEKAPGQILIKTGISIEVDGQEKPALVAEILSMFIVQQQTRET